jgi:hypothetical protein
MAVEFVRKPPHERRRFYHQSLGAGNFVFESAGFAPGGLLQQQQPDIDAQQSLGDFVPEFMAEFYALILLPCQHPVRQLPQLLLLFK